MSIVIDPSKGSSLALAEQLLERYANQELWIDRFKLDIENARYAYDDKNNKIDAFPYPEEAVLREKYKSWETALQEFAKKEEALSQLATDFEKQMSFLKKITYTPDEIAKARAVH